MSKSWLSWFGERGAAADRRVRPMPELPQIDPADIDPATGTVRWSRFSAIVAGAQQPQVVQAILVIDLDNRSEALEAVAGENEAEILPLLVQAIRQAVRTGDPIARMHHYTFAVLLPGAPPEMAAIVAARIQESVDDTLFLTASGLAKLGVAVGGVVSVPTKADRPDLIDAAITNLGAAKAAANQVVIG
jgi:diguanylate cyclase (GGDEF)-like protein